MFVPFGGFADSVPALDGKVRLPDVPGIGMEEKANVTPIYEKLIS